MIRMLLPDSDSLFVVVTAAALGRCRWHIALESVLLLHCRIDPSTACRGTWQPRCSLLRIACVGPASVGVSENANRQAAALRGSERKESEAEVRLEHGDRLRTRPPHKSPGYLKNKSSFHQRFRRLEPDSPVRSGMFATRPSPRTPISAVSEARSIAANPSSTRDDEQPRREQSDGPLRAGS